MGFYVKLTKSTAVIPSQHKAEVLKLWKLLNHPMFNDKKRGGSYVDGQKAQHWYSWMDPDYDKTCNTVESILDMLGFDHDLTEDGGISISDYDNKTGQEQVFFNAVAHLVTGEMFWIGEDEETYYWNFDAITEPMFDPTMLKVLELESKTDQEKMLEVL